MGVGYVIFMDTLGKRLKHLRTVSQAETARRLGIPQTTWSNYEQDKNKPALVLLDKICQEFGVSLEWLLYGRGPIRADAPPLPEGAAVSLDIVYDVVETLEEYLQGQGRNLSPGLKAEVVRQLCRMVVEEEEGTVKPAQMMRLIRGALASSA